MFEDTQELVRKRGRRGHSDKREHVRNIRGRKERDASKMPEAAFFLALFTHHEGKAAASKRPLRDAPEPFISKISFGSPNSPVGISPILQMSNELGVAHNSLAAVLMRRAEGREPRTIHPVFSHQSCCRGSGRAGGSRGGGGI